MKKLLLAFVLFAAPAVAQETYSVPGTAGQVADLSGIVTASNERTCLGLNLVLTCTQAQACTAANAVGGAACTAAQARAASARIYPLTQPGREEYVQVAIVLARFNQLKAEITRRAQERLATFCLAATQLQKDALCTDSGQSASCLLCP